MIGVEAATYQIQPFSNSDSFELAQRIGKALSCSTLVPVEYQGEKGFPNTLIALEMSGRIGISPLMTMQNLRVIHGRPSWSSTFLIAMVNACGRFILLRYRLEGKGDERSCVAYTTDKATGEMLEGPEVSITMAKAEGWYGRNGSKWKNMPDLMLTYRSAAFFARTYCPEVALGLHTTEEIYDYDEVQVQASRVSESEKAKDLTAQVMGEVPQVMDAELKPTEEKKTTRTRSKEPKEAVVVEEDTQVVPDESTPDFGAPEPEQAAISTEDPFDLKAAEEEAAAFL